MAEAILLGAGILLSALAIAYATQWRGEADEARRLEDFRRAMEAAPSQPEEGN